MKIKQLLSFVIALFLMLHLGNIAIPASQAQAAEETMPPSHEQVTDTPVRLSLTEDTPVFQAGESKEITLQISNSGTQPIKSLSFTPRLSANTLEWPFAIENISYSQSIDQLDPGQTVNVTHSFTARSNVGRQYYPLVFDLAYQTDGSRHTTSQTVYVRTEGQGDNSDSVQTNQDQLSESNPSNRSTFNAEFDNSSGGLSGDYSSMPAGTITNNESLPSGGLSQSASSTPRVIVTGFTTEPGEVKAGSNFKLTAKLKNTSASTSVKNMIVSFSSANEGTDENSAPAFLPVSGSNTVYVDSISAGTEKELTIELNARNDLIQKPYTVSLELKYENSANEQFESTANMSVPIKQDSRFELSKIEVSPESAEVGDEINIISNLHNTGRTRLHNAKVTVEGEGLEKTDSFLGNVESGSEAAIDVMAKVTKKAAKTQKAKLLLTYEDGDGKTQNFEQEFEVTVVKATAAVPSSQKQEDSQSRSGLPLLPLLLFLSAVGVGLVWWMRRKKARRDADL